MVNIIKHKKWLVVVLTTIAFVAVSFMFNMDYWLMQKPKSVHVWRQCDGASYALNYYQNNRPFFKPQVHHRMARDGETCSEFPLIYYVASKLYAVFGYHDYYVRWIGYLIFYASLIALSLTSLIFIRNIFLALSPALFWMTSCLSMYYAGNFLPDMPALSCAIIGFYFFIRFTEGKHFSHFAWAILFTVLAALLKVSSAFILVIISLYLSYQVMIAKSKSYTIKHLILMVVSWCAVVAWTVYATWYNKQGGYDGNLLGTSGIWLIDDWSYGKYILSRTYNEWLPAIHSYWIWSFLVVGLLFIIIKKRSVDKRLKFFIGFLLLGVAIYFLSWFTVFDNHDYYLTNTICLPIILTIALAQIIDKMKVPSLRYIGLLIVGIFIIVNTIHGQDQMNERQFNKAYNNQEQAFYTITPYLRSIGVMRKDLVFVMPDGSTNIPLYLMNNPGFTTFAGRDIARAVADGAQYLIISEEEILKDEKTTPYIKNQIGYYEGVYIFKL